MQLVDYLQERGQECLPLRLFLLNQKDLHGWTTYALGEHMDLSQGTAVRLLNGGYVPKEVTLRKIARAFDLPITEVRRMAQRSAGELAPFGWPDEFNQLPQRVRDALLNFGWAYLDGVAERVTRSA